MPLTPGSRLGPYEILSAIGAGGMGEVYRAKDPRLGREVAIKVLPASFSTDADRLRRFEQEAKAAGVLNHPNITAVYDIGTHDGAPYVVQELLEGETLRATLGRARLSPRKAIDYSVQIVHGLAAAHEKGIVHRDLKPENLFVTKDGRVKILDFGLAKLTHTEEQGQVTNLPTATQGTEPGVVLGTLGYMSPEQVRGRSADARSDIFSFGAILYEMLSGRRAFRGDSAADTMSAILKEDPPDLSVTNQSISPGLERIVRHCLEKNPEQRFHSAHDLAFDLEALSGTSATSAGAIAPAATAGRRRWLLPAVGVAVVAAAVAAALLAVRRAENRARPEGATFQQLTFRPQTIFSARFAADGKTVVFSAAPQGNSPQLFVVRPEFPDPRPMGVGAVHLLAVSSRGELAVLTGPRFIAHNIFQGTLARMPLEGGAPRDVIENVREADWSPDGAQLAVIREVNGKDRLEFPVGKVLYETGGYLSDPRFSPGGDRIAFFEHPWRYDDRGQVAVVDLSGKKTVLTGGYWGEEGLAWSQDGAEVLFSAGNAYSAFRIYAVTLTGRRRVALESAGGLTIRDVRRDGKWLATRDDYLQSMPVSLAGQSAERDLSWLDFSFGPMLSADGKTVIFDEESGTVGVNYAVCLRRTDGSPVVRLGEGHTYDLSPDGRSVLAVVPTTPPQLVLYPTGAGDARHLERGEIEAYESGKFFPDGGSLLICGHERGRASRCYVQAIGGGKPKPLTPEGTTAGIVSPDGQKIVVAGNGGLFVYPAGGGDGSRIPGTTRDDEAIRWSSDGGSILAFRQNDIPLRVERIALSTGRRDLVRTIGPADLGGVVSLITPFLSADGQSYAYVISRTISHLFLVEGAR
ncbi:MAG TPA: protein kinase [Thermoanaerobaculia bacterium]|nr:protein kinase [Thermoanaerobaculia bacterium]